MKYVLFPLFSLLFICAQGQDTQVYTSRDVDQFPFIRSKVCDSPGTQDCFEKQLRAHISETFQFPAKAQEQGLSGRAYVQFTVGLNGEVNDIKTRAKDELFAEEARRITALIPELKAATKSGEPVAMKYSFPLEFTFKADPVPFEDTAVPPVFNVCQESKDLKGCLLQYFFENIMPRITEDPEIQKKQRRQDTYQVWTRFYFEITPEGTIQNLTTVSNEDVAKAITERFIREDLRIVRPARNEADQPILCSYVEELRAFAVKREKRAIGYPDRN